MKKVTLILLACILLLIACSSNDDEQQAEEHDERNTERESKDESATETQGENQYPLTGHYTDDPVNNRIISVMVNNHGQARPQTGLAAADIVFEILAEARITRFLALYQSEIPDIIGPVRSAREYYFDIANNYDALYLYHGAADFINNMIINQGIPYLDGAIHDNDGYLFKRESFRQAPHNSYLIAENVYDAAGNNGYDIEMEHAPLPFLQADEISEIDGLTANHVEIVYSDNPMWVVAFEYDQKTGKYSRFSDDEQTIDLGTEEEVAVENVFIIETYHEVIDNAGRRNVDIQSGGNAYLIQNGVAQQVEWVNENGRILPMRDGETVGFVPGKTWINVVPTSPSMEQSVTISGE